jgi:hypothetical protein
MRLAQRSQSSMPLGYFLRRAGQRESDAIVRAFPGEVGIGWAPSMLTQFCKISRMDMLSQASFRG